MAIRKLALVGLAAGLTASGLAQGPGQGPARPRATRTVVKSPKAPAAQPPSQAPPQVVAPPRPEQMTPVPPQVTYQDGLLSIQAQNSTLSSILTAVRARTGARVEMPADTANDRAAAQLGPGNPRDVLASLLQGSRFDYIVIGSPTDPDALSEIILTPHAGGSGGKPGNDASIPLPGGSQQMIMPRIAGGAGRPEINADDDEAAAEPQPPVYQPPVYQPPPPQSVSGAEQPGPPNLEPGQQGKPNEVKTPEQLLKELQRMQQQQQQQGRRQPQQE
ncbi:MAG: hypothetical protein LAN70_17300 [Acidobacteriia bacterium]|nr:hypothetical protein [Terriglobia bacterium]